MQNDYRSAPRELEMTPKAAVENELTQLIPFQPSERIVWRGRECLFGRDNSAGVARCQGEI